MSSGPAFVSYGETDNMHGLLSSELKEIELPRELLGLTDRPPGTYAPGEQWSPSVGCGPVGKFWAIWWTTPDDHAHRGGMVKSVVAMWADTDIGSVTDIRPILVELSGSEVLPVASPTSIITVANAIINSSPPKVFSSLEEWPDALATIWPRLWPSARAKFSGRVVVSPPQGGESIAPPNIYVAPHGRLSQWPVGQLAQSDVSETDSRAALWLTGASDPVLEEILEQAPPLPPEIASLSRIARAASRLDRLRKSPSLEVAVEVLRTLVAIGPDRTELATLKREAQSVVEENAPFLSSSNIQSLANFKLASLPGNVFAQIVSDWTGRYIPILPPEELGRILAILTPSMAQEWWQDAIIAGIKSGIRSGEGAWNEFLFEIISSAETPQALQALIPWTSTTAQVVFDLAGQRRLNEEQLTQLVVVSRAQLWSKLHGLVMRYQSPGAEGIKRQLAFPGDVAPGLSVVCAAAKPQDVIQALLDTDDGRLLSYVVQLTLADQTLLNQLDLTNPIWSRIWLAHVRAGGKVWPPALQQEVLATQVIDQILALNAPADLLKITQPISVYVLLRHSRREYLWNVITGAPQQEMLHATALALLEDRDPLLFAKTPEPMLASEIIRTGTGRRLTDFAIAGILAWQTQISESIGTDWLQPGHWGRFGNEIGLAVKHRQWRRASELIYKLFDAGNSQLRPAVDKVVDLLGWWDQTRYAYRYGIAQRTRPSTTDLARRAAEIGARLAPERIDDLWERAGGKRAKLSGNGTWDVKWREAALLAANGGLTGGLARLLKELEDDFPLNSELNELTQMIKGTGSIH